jgi:hypothetical protein
MLTTLSVLKDRRGIGTGHRFILWTQAEAWKPRLQNFPFNPAYCVNACSAPTTWSAASSCSGWWWPDWRW